MHFLPVTPLANRVLKLVTQSEKWFVNQRKIILPQSKSVTHRLNCWKDKQTGGEQKRNVACLSWYKGEPKPHQNVRTCPFCLVLRSEWGVLQEREVPDQGERECKCAYGPCRQRLPSVCQVHMGLACGMIFFSVLSRLAHVLTSTGTEAKPCVRR